MPAKSVKIPNGLGVGVGAATGVATGAFTGALEGEGDGPGDGIADVVGAKVCVCDMKIYKRVGEPVLHQKPAHPNRSSTFHVPNNPHSS